MKKWQIIKLNNGWYALATKEDIKIYKEKFFLPYETSMKYKKYLIELINKTEKYKNNVDFKTYFTY